MADQPSIHIDTDWKKQAQEEKRKLAEAEEKKKQTAAAAPAGPVMGGAGVPTASAPPASRAAGGASPAKPEARELPPPSFVTLTQSIVTQVLFYLGELASRGGEKSINLDMAKHNIDILAILEEKTRGNLRPEEKSMLDSALYETRMRYVSVASQFIV